MADEKSKQEWIESELDTRMSAETKTFVSGMLALMRPADMVRMGVPAVRQMREQMAQAQAGAYSFDQVEVTDLTVPNSSADNTVNIPVKCFRSKEAAANAPLVVYFHGGGWTYGSAQVNYHACASIAQATKSVWLSVDYRLGPEHKLDAQLSDCKSVVDYVLRNKQQFSGADAKLGLSGDSAGGHLAATMAHEFREKFDFQILVYPGVDLDMYNNNYESVKEFSRDGFMMVPEQLHFCRANLLDDMSESTLRSPHVSPLYRDDFAKLPKCLMLLAELDPLTDSCVAYHQKMLDNASSSQLHVVKGVIHSFFDQGVSLPSAFGEGLSVIQSFMLSL